MDPQGLLDAAGYIRYGMSTADKEKIAREGLLPGAPKDTSAGQEKADRYASGYLFTSNWPRLSKAIMPAVSMARAFVGDTPELQSFAQSGMNRALMDLSNVYTTPVNTGERPWEDYESEAANRIRLKRPAAEVQSEALKRGK